MANVIVKIVGQGAPEEYEAKTLGELKKELDLEGDWGAAVNRKAIDNSYEFQDNDMVVFKENSKGGAR